MKFVSRKVNLQLGTNANSGQNFDRRLLRRMALRNKFLSLACAPDLVDIDTYFFSKKIFRSDTRICVTITSFFELFLSPVVQSTRARLIETPPTKYCGSAAVVRRGGRMGDIWGAAPRLEARSSSRTAVPRCFCPELEVDLPTWRYYSRRHQS